MKNAAAAINSGLLGDPGERSLRNPYSRERCCALTSLRISLPLSEILSDFAVEENRCSVGTGVSYSCSYIFISFHCRCRIRNPRTGV